MKKRIVMLGLAGGVVGMLLWMGGHTIKESDASQKSISLEKKALATASSIEKETISSKESSLSIAKPKETATSNKERQTILADGTIRVDRLVWKKGSSLPMLVSETLRKNEDLGRYQTIGRVEMLADRVLVQLKEDVDYSLLEALVKESGGEIVQALSDGKTYLVKLEAPSLDAVREAISFFEKSASQIAYAEPDYLYRLTKTPNDTMYADLWHMGKISAPSAWDLATGNKSITVAIIDTGMDMTHFDLQGNLWSNPNEIPNDNLDNDGNGYVDDVHGWDFTDKDNDPSDEEEHGTHCAGIVGAVGNNTNQVVGVCWSVNLMPLRASYSAQEGYIDIVAASEATRYAANNGAKIISNSYGAQGRSQTQYEAIEYANEKGCVFLAASGNGGDDLVGDNNDQAPIYPASYDLPNVISVAASDQNDALASFSNYGKESVDLAAPGVDILSTVPGGGTALKSGTSMACPMVAGALALYMSQDPNIDPAAAKTILLQSVDLVPSLNSKLVSGGRLNLQALLSSLLDADQDGMPDDWENAHGLNPNDPADAMLDPDSDFLDNLSEYKNGCDPFNSDSDADSLLDGWEVRYGFNPLNTHATLPRLLHVGFTSGCQDPQDITINNGYAYVADGSFGLKILDISTPKKPVLVGSYSTSGTASGVFVAGNYAYVVSSDADFSIINISNPQNPVLAGTLAGVSAEKVVVGGGYAYLAAGTNGVLAVNVSNPAAPVQTANFTGNGDPAFKVNDVTLVGSALYMALDGGLGKLSTPALTGYSVKGISDADGNSDCTSIFYNGSELYLTLKDYGFFVYSLSKNLLGSAETSGSAEDIYQSEGLIYVADGDRGLQIFNGSDFSDMPRYASYENLSLQALFLSDGYIYGAQKGSGLHIFKSAVDSDADGMYDGWELKMFGSLTENYTDDYDNDGIINWGEYLTELCPTNADQDADGLVDGIDEVQTYNTDPRKADTDDDGLSDLFEVTTNETDNLFITDPLTPDTDGDGMTDKWEIENGLDPTLDDAAGDADGDGLSNKDEEKAGTSPSNPDTDSDGIPDGWEVEKGLDPLVNDAGLDPDGDGLTSLEEYNQRLQPPYYESTNPLKADSDADGLSDGEEIQQGTDPNNPDTDGDDMPDGWEVDHGLDPFVQDGDGDLDGDGLSNKDEFLNGSDPHSADSDADGFGDQWEYDWGTQATNAADPVVVDDDAPNDPAPQDPSYSDPSENGSLDHPFDAIQEAIDVSESGYTILVKEGKYYGDGNRALDLGELQLRILAERQDDPSKTAIKSHGLSVVITFSGGQDTNTILSGFTIQSSVQGDDCSDGDCGEMHGIVCKDASSPSITNCIVEYCRSDAIYCEFDSNPKILNVLIRNIFKGCGIYALESSPEIVDCVITNIQIEEFEGGSGIYAQDVENLNISRTSIENTGGRGLWLVNVSTGLLFDVSIKDGWGGVRCENSSPTFDRCTIADNEAPDFFTKDDTLWKAKQNMAKIAIIPDSGVDDIPNPDENGGGILLMKGSHPTFQNCLIANNRTWALDFAYPSEKLEPDYGLGGGIYVGSNCVTRTINCTIADNTAMTRGGGMASMGNFREYLRNDILWGNVCSNAWVDKDADPPVFYEPGDPSYNALLCHKGLSHFDPWYCDIGDGGGFVGDRYNIELDPKFAGATDYHLLSDSPCIDAGTFYSAPLYDRDGMLRPLDGNGDDIAKMDIGAYEFPAVLLDSDGDGMPDVFEQSNGLNPNQNDANADADADNLSNLAEYIAGTDPLDANSVFEVNSVQPLAGGGFEIAFDTVAGRTYAVYYKDNLENAWTLLQDGISGTGFPVSITDSGTASTRFYQVRVSR